MNKLQKELNEIDKKVDDLVWDIKIKENNIEKLKKEMVEDNELLDFLIRTKRQEQVKLNEQ